MLRRFEGKKVIFVGGIDNSKTDEFTKDLARKHLIEGEIYTIREAQEFGDFGIHYKFGVPHVNCVWFPSDCFTFMDGSNSILKNLYGLK